MSKQTRKESGTGITIKWQNETGSVEGLARRPIGKVNRPPDLKKVNKMS